MLGCVRPQPKVRVSMLTKDCQSAHKEAHLYRQLERKCKGSRIQTYFIDEIIYDNGLDRSGGRACYLILRHLAVASPCSGPAAWNEPTVKQVSS